jgi:hypothetical protein
MLLLSSLFCFSCNQYFEEVLINPMPKGNISFLLISLKRDILLVISLKMLVYNELILASALSRDSDALNQASHK